MIRVIGLNDTVYENILNHNNSIVRNWSDKGMNYIEFIPACSLNFEEGKITIECSDNCVTFLCCDYWRIEIE